MPDPDLRPENPHPPAWQRDLNPDFLAGQNFTVNNADAAKDWPSAFDNKTIHRALGELLDDAALKQVPVLPVGTRLEQGATYIDLHQQTPVPFTATSIMEAGPKHAYVPKAQVPYPIWNRLIGIQDPARLEESA
jgi:hypothetical protein